MSHHIHNILLFRVKFGLEVEGLGFPGSRYALFLTMLLYVIHFYPQLSSGSKRARFCSEQAEMCI